MGSWAQRKAGWLGAHAIHHGTIQEVELIVTHTRAEAHSIHENQSHERCHSASQTGQEGSDKQPSQEVGTQALCGAVLLSVHGLVSRDHSSAAAPN